MDTAKVPKFIASVQLITVLAIIALFGAMFYVVREVQDLKQNPTAEAAPIQTVSTTPDVLVTAPPVETTTSTTMDMLPLPEAVTLSTIEVSYPMLFEAETPPCLLSFDGKSRLCASPNVVANTNDEYFPGNEFKVSLQIYIEPRLNGCADFDTCFELVPASVCPDVLGEIERVGRELGADSAFNGGVPGVTPEDVVLRYWDAYGENREIFLESDCDVRIEQHETIVYELPGT